jgi:hypothetical protein
MPTLITKVVYPLLFTLYSALSILLPFLKITHYYLLPYSALLNLIKNIFLKKNSIHYSFKQYDIGIRDRVKFSIVVIVMLKS